MLEDWQAQEGPYGLHKQNGVAGHAKDGKELHMDKLPGYAH